VTRLASVWLLVTAAVCGAVVMALELLGARMLGVAYGGSLAVWAAMIAVTLLSLAVGYFLGGWLADRHPRPALLYGCLLAAAALVALCPHARFILKACHGALGLTGGALASSALIFALPLGLLGITSPFIIRVLCVFAGTDGRGVGIRAGGVYAISTLGSVAGTLLTGLWLIPAFGTGAGFRITATAAAAAGAVGLAAALGWRGAAALAVPAALALLPGAAARVGLVYTAPDGERVEIKAVRDSAHGRIAVLDKGGYRLLVVNGIVQTGAPRDLARLTKGQMLAADYFQELLPYTVDDPRGKSALIIGLAGGMTASLLRLYGLDLDCVDLDPEIIAVAREYFSFTGPAEAADGRMFLEGCRKRYDFCVIDTYSGDVFPFHLATREAFEAAKRVLKPGGMLAVNYIGAPGGRAFACLDLTLRGVFAEVLAIGGEPGGDVQTITVFASDRKIGFNKGWLELGGGFSGVDPVTATIGRLKLAPPAGLLRQRASETSEASAKEVGFVLTDDYNPIDFLRAGEALRWRERTARNIGEQAIF
jgi:predicted membrane-bound spermidine synthase